MRIYCHICGKVTRFNTLSPTAISCTKCNHEQAINSMAESKKGSVTGANLGRKTGKGKLTNSARFQPPSVEEKAVAPTPQTTPQTTNNRTNESSLNSRSNNSVKLANSDHNQTFNRAIDLASKYGVQPIDISSLMGSNPYAADGSAPEMTAAEANQIKLKLQRQSNAIEVRHEKIKYGRKVVKMATEQVGLIGDFVDHATAEINVASKIVKNEIALAQFDIEQSRLTNTLELLTQQQIATAGTIALTEGIREEWSLKLQKQNTRNGGMKIEIESSMLENHRKLQEMEVKLLAE